MPPRIPLLQCLRVSSATCPSTSCRSFTSTSASPASTVTQRRRKHDPYAIAQAKARKAANLSRQKVLKKERVASLGDPVRGITTPFVRSFDTAKPLEPGEQSLSTRLRLDTNPGEAPPAPQEESANGNFFLNPQELQQEVDHSKYLSTPSPNLLEQDDPTSEYTPEERKVLLAQQHATAEEALRRISSLSLGNSQDRMKVNTRRCISTFGRHSTDHFLTPLSNPATTIADIRTQSDADNEAHVIPRIGPDTGSSEVQIAILTAKIRTLSEFLQTRGRTDKMNKRNLRLLVHRRQKLLQYLRRKDRGGSRWQYCVEMLGLTEGTWGGEISL